LNWLKQNHPELPLELLVLGKADPSELTALPYPIHALGLVTDPKKLVKAYGMADVFVIPSLEDNLPNTVMESLACGTPVAGFTTGGIPEMVKDGYNGHLASQRDSQGLAIAIKKIVESENVQKRLRTHAREWVEQHYHPKVVVDQYIKVYQQGKKAL
jgi:glycosyltransferase involved in cell wall biosynthesis